MRCPRLLGLMTRARVVFAREANTLSIQLPDDSEIDLVLIDCFTPPLLEKVDHYRIENGEKLLFHKERPNQLGVAALKVTTAAIAKMPTWTRVFFPTPRNDREWFRNLKPGSKQPGHIWITDKETLNEHLVQAGVATVTQPDYGSPNFDGQKFATSQEDVRLWSFSAQN